MKRLRITYTSLLAICFLFSACQQQDLPQPEQGERMALTVGAASVEGNNKQISTRAETDGAVITGFLTGDVITMELGGTMERTVYVRSEGDDLWGLYADADCEEEIDTCYVDPLDITVTGSFVEGADNVKAVPEFSVYTDRLIAEGTGVGIRAGVGDSFGKLVVEFYFQHERALLSATVLDEEGSPEELTVLTAHITDAKGFERDLNLIGNAVIAPEGARLTGFTVGEDEVMLDEEITLEAGYHYPFQIRYASDEELRSVRPVVLCNKIQNRISESDKK